MTPTDDLAFVGLPTIEHLAMDIDSVHISVTFSWDLEKAEELYEAWQMLGVPVEVGTKTHYKDGIFVFQVLQRCSFVSRSAASTSIPFWPTPVRITTTT